MMPAQIAA
jgi:hypothetical protein